jgi:hypothetical protein
MITTVRWKKLGVFGRIGTKLNVARRSLARPERGRSLRDATKAKRRVKTCRLPLATGDPRRQKTTFCPEKSTYRKPPRYAS